MLEVDPHTPGRLPDTTQGTQPRSLQVCHVLRRHAALALTLQVAIKVLGWHQLREVRRQLEYLDSVDALFAPLAHHLVRLDVQIVPIEEPLARRVLDQSLHEHDQSHKTQTARVAHEPRLPLIRHCRDHREALSTGGALYDWRLPRRRITAMATLVQTNPSLLTPAHFGVFSLRARLVLRIFEQQPVLHRRVVALVCTPRCVLRRVAPPRHVLTDPPTRQADVTLTLGEIANRTPGPQCKRKRELIRALPADLLACPTLVLRRHSSQAPLRPPTTRHPFQHLQRSLQTSKRRRDIQTGVSRNLHAFDGLFALLAQRQHLATQLQTDVRACPSTLRVLPQPASCPLDVVLSCSKTPIS